MTKYLIALLALLTFVNFSFANENVDDELEEVELNAFGYPEGSFVKLIKNEQIGSRVLAQEKPNCNDKKLINMAREIAKPLVDSHDVTIVNKRRNILITKNIDNFTELNIVDAYDIENKIVKARLVELKINNKLDNSNFKICQTNNKILRDKLFILMYDDDDNIKVELLNLAIDSTPSFYFYDK